jgi:DNA-binding MarR family transcriptional regulator
MDLIRDVLGFRMGAAYRRIERLHDRAFREIGISHAHAQILTCLLQDGPLRPGDIEKRTGFEQSTVSRLVKELARRKLVRKGPHPSDRRARLLSAAKRGEALRKPIESIYERLNARLRRDLTEIDLEGFAQTIAVMDRLP